MEQKQKNLKNYSIVVLLYAGLSLFNIVTELLFGELNSAEIPSDAPGNILFITKMILLGLSVLFLLPKVYVGVKGLKIAKNPDSSKKHIIWAGIILAFSALEFIEPVSALFAQGVSGNLKPVLEVLLDIVIYYEYIHHAKELAKEAE